MNIANMEFTCTHPPHLPGENGTEIGVAILCLPNKFVHKHMESLAYSNVFRCAHSLKKNLNPRK